MELIGKGIAKMFYLHGKQYNPEMIQIFTEEIIDTYKHETPETILLFLSKAAKGDFGKFYGNPDIGTITEWMADFLQNTVVPERERQNQYRERDNSGRGQARSLKDFIEGSKKSGPIFIPGITKR